MWLRLSVRCWRRGKILWNVLLKRSLLWFLIWLWHEARLVRLLIMWLWRWNLKRWVRCWWRWASQLNFRIFIASLFILELNCRSLMSYYLNLICGLLNFLYLKIWASYCDLLLRFFSLHRLLLKILTQLLMLALDHNTHVIAHYQLSLRISVLEELLNCDWWFVRELID